jgi:hypothetical protein
MPSRAIEKMVEVLIRADPSHARSEREKAQADEIYLNGNLRVYASDSCIMIDINIFFSRYHTQERHLLLPQFQATPTTLAHALIALLATLSAGHAHSPFETQTYTLMMHGTLTKDHPLGMRFADIGQ